METKLTLKLKSAVIARAKNYAREHQTSISRMVEAYLDSVTANSESTPPSITPLVERLSGVIDLPADFDYKQSYRDYLQEKYK
ncbi:MAG: DUF6364 family protein [Bacteroidia bacterium]